MRSYRSNSPRRPAHRSPSVNGHHGVGAGHHDGPSDLTSKPSPIAEWVYPHPNGLSNDTAGADFNGAPARTALGFVRGRRILAVADDDNINVSAEKRGITMCYGRLLDRLENMATSVNAAAILTSVPGVHHRRNMLLDAGFSALELPRRKVAHVSGARTISNDFDIAFEVARLLTVHRYDLVLLGTGDGDLAEAVAAGVRRVRRSIMVATFSIAGTASSRLRPGSLFHANILIGRDLLRPNRRKDGSPGLAAKAIEMTG